jgi:hypothetical protein
MRSSTPSTRSRSRRFAPDRAASRGEPHLKAVSGFLRAVEFRRGTMRRMFKRTRHDLIARVLATHPHPYPGAGRGAVNAPPRHLMRVAKVCASERETGPTITAALQRGPLAGRRIDVDVVEGRPPKRSTCGPTTGAGVATASRTGPRPVRPPYTRSCTSYSRSQGLAPSCRGDGERQHDHPPPLERQPRAPPPDARRRPDFPVA